MILIDFFFNFKFKSLALPIISNFIRFLKYKY